MLVVTMNAAVRKQSNKMELMASRAHKSFPRSGIPSEFAFRNRFIDSSKILMNDPACPKVEMTYFRVSHLSFRETDIETTRT